MRYVEAHRKRGDRPADTDWAARMRYESYEIDDCAYVWPENEATVDVWWQCQTQWRIGMGGAMGLDYAGVRALLDELELAGPERREIFDGLMTMERATLEALK